MLEYLEVIESSTEFNLKIFNNPREVSDVFKGENILNNDNNNFF